MDGLPHFVESARMPTANLRPWSNNDSNQCRYIAAEVAGPDYIACGEPTLPGDSWCAACRKIVYQQTTERAR